MYNNMCVVTIYIYMYLILICHVIYHVYYLCTYYYILLYILSLRILYAYIECIYIYISIIHITYSHIEYTVDCIIFWLSAQRSASRFEVSNAGLEDQQLHLFRRGTWRSWGTWWRGQRPKQSWYLPSGYFV